MFLVFFFFFFIFVLLLLLLLESVLRFWSVRRAGKATAGAASTAEAERQGPPQTTRVPAAAPPELASTAEAAAGAPRERWGTSRGTTRASLNGRGNGRGPRNDPSHRLRDHADAASTAET